MEGMEGRKEGRREGRRESLGKMEGEREGGREGSACKEGGRQEHLTKRELCTVLKMVDASHRNSLQYGISVLKKLDYNRPVRLHACGGVCVGFLALLASFSQHTCIHQTIFYKYMCVHTYVHKQLHYQYVSYFVNYS